MYICYGISNGPYWNGPREIGEESQFLWRAEIAVQDKEELVLSVPDFDPTQSAPVRITLKDRDSGVLVIELMANSCLLNGKPELVWGQAT